MAEPDRDVPGGGRLAGGTHLFPVRVYYEDTDAGGVVYHASYLRFMERARTEMLAACGIDVAAAARGDVGQFVAAEAALRFRRPARLGEALVVASRIVGIRRAACVVQQEVMRDGAGIATGRLTIVFVGGGGRPRRLPDAWIAALRPVTGDGSIA